MSESLSQAKIVRYLTNTYGLKHHKPRLLIFSCPNGGTRNKIEAMTLKATGLLPGVSDLILVYPGKILFLELKILGKTQSPAQLDFEQRVTDNGFPYACFDNYENCIRFVEQWLDS